MSSRLGALDGTGPGAPALPQQLQPGIVVATPASLGDDVYVTLDNLDDEQPVGPCLGWRNVDSSMWPTAGAKALVLRVEQATLDGIADDWIVAWE